MEGEQRVGDLRGALVEDGWAAAGLLGGSMISDMDLVMMRLLAEGEQLTNELLCVAESLSSCFCLVR